MKTISNGGPVARTNHYARYWAALLTIAVLVLSACGAKLETSLDLENAEKGSRTMSISFNMKDNKDYLKGDINAIDASLKKHVPSELSYEGIQVEGDKAKATFKLSFSSVSEYRSKVEKLLKLSGSSNSPSITISDSKEGLVQGTQISENFASKDLLGWIGEGLVVDGIIESKRKSSVLGSEDKTVVKIAGKEVKNSGYSSGVSVKDIKDNGFKSVAINAEPQENGGYKAQVFFKASSIMDPEKAKTVDSYLNGVKPDGTQLTKGVDEKAMYPNGGSGSSSSEANTTAGKEEMGRTLSFEASSLEDLSTKLQKVFSSQDVSLQQEQTVNDSSGKLTVTHKITGQLNCSQVCSPDGSGITFNITGQDLNYTDGKSSYSSSSAEKLNKAIELTATREISVQEVKTSVALGMDGSVEARFEYFVKNSDAEIASDALTQRFSPSESDGSLEEKEDGDNTIYSAVIRGKDSADFNQHLESYLPNSDSKFAVHHGGGYNPFGTSYTVEPKMDISEKVGDSYSGQSTFTFTAPFMSSVDKTKFEDGNSSWLSASNTNVNIDGQKLTLTRENGLIYAAKDGGTEFRSVPASGLTMSDLIIDAVIVALLLLILLVLFLFRKRIAASRRAARERRARLAAADQIQEQGYGGQGHNPEMAVLSQAAPANVGQQYYQPQPTQPISTSNTADPPTAPIGSLPAPAGDNDETRVLSQQAHTADTPTPGGGNNAPGQDTVSLETAPQETVALNTSGQEASEQGASAPQGAPDAPQSSAPEAAPNNGMQVDTGSNSEPDSQPDSEQQGEQTSREQGQHAPTQNRSEQAQTLREQPPNQPAQNAGPQNQPPREQDFLW